MPPAIDAVSEVGIGSGKSKNRANRSRLRHIDSKASDDLGDESDMGPVTSFLEPIQRWPVADEFCSTLEPEETIIPSGPKRMTTRFGLL